MRTDEIHQALAEPPEFRFPVLGETNSAEPRMPFPTEGRHRVAIENVFPSIDGGRFPIKRTIGERVIVEADLFADSHVLLSAVVKYRQINTEDWFESPMVRVANDRWRAEFTVTSIGVWVYTIVAWVDRFKTWRDELRKKIAAGQNVDIELVAGAKLVEEVSCRTNGSVSSQLAQWAKALTDGKTAGGTALAELALDETMGGMVMRYSDREFATSLDQNLRVVVSQERARFSTWYEMFPRSFSREPGQHGTFKDCELQLPRIAKMGFDVLYLPPIHPVGKSFRKGRNNNPVCQPDDPGSPWAIGATEGGHKAVHPQSGPDHHCLPQCRAMPGKNLPICDCSSLIPIYCPAKNCFSWVTNSASKIRGNRKQAWIGTC